MTKLDVFPIYIVYKTTNTVNNYIYIGVHKITCSDDNYLGSGKYLKRAIKQYGKHSFLRETLHTFSNKKDAYMMEAEIVDGIFVNRTDTYNINYGGDGGFEYINTNKQYFNDKAKLTIDSWTEQRKIEVNSKKIKRGCDNGMYGSNRCGELNPMYGKHHSEESCNKIKDKIEQSYKNGFINPRLGKQLSLEQRNIISQNNSKHWKFNSINGVIEVFNLEKFCREHDLNPLCMYRVSCGKQKSHKGYTQYVKL